MPPSQLKRRLRAYRNTWRTFYELIAGGYPDDATTMEFARRSVEETNRR